MTTYLLYALLVLLVLLSAFFSSSEIAYATANKLRLQNDADKGGKLAAKAMWISERGVVMAAFRSFFVERMPRIVSMVSRYTGMRE